MNATEIFAQIRGGSESFPRRQLEKLLAEPAATRQLALGVMEDWIAKIERGENDPDDQGTFYAMFLLAELREPKAYPLFLKLLRFPNAADEEILGDVLAEYVHKFLAAVAAGDTRELLALAEDRTAGDPSRAAAISALLVQLNAGEHTREEVLAHFARLFRSTERKRSALWNDLLDDAVDLQSLELLAEIRAAIQAGLPESEMSVEEVEALIRLPSEKSFLSGLQYQPLGDWLGELEEWNFNVETPAPVQKPAVSTKIARNDPCPCGSGKKYKKCHGA